MAKELSTQELLDLSRDYPYKYEQVLSMLPLWKPFLLDLPERARLHMIKTNNSNLGAGSVYYKFMSKITGIDESKIDTLIINGDGQDGVVTVIPCITTQEFSEFLESRNSESSTRLTLVKS